MKSFVVTGVSTGIGLATTRLLIQRGFRVFGSVRKPQDAPRDLGPNFHPLVFDVTDPNAVCDAAAEVRQALAGAKLDGLINNSGIAVPGPVLHLPLDDFRRQMEVNVTGIFIVTQAFLPVLGCDRALRGEPGRIVNVSSMAGKIGWPMLGAYSASKHALEGLSESLRRELALYGIKVVIVGPGAVKTPIWAKSSDGSPYDGTEYAGPFKRMQAAVANLEASALEASEVAAVILDALTRANPAVRYAVVKSRLQNWWLPMLMPRKLFDTAMIKRLGLTNPAR